MARRPPVVRNRSDGSRRVAKLGNVNAGTGSPALPFVDQETIVGDGTFGDPFRALGGVSPGTGQVFGFRVVTPGSSYTIPLPIEQPNIDYVVFVQCQGVTNMVASDVPPGGLTTSSFVVNFSGETTAGDEFVFFVIGRSA